MTITMERPQGTEIRANRATKKAGGLSSSATQCTGATSPTNARGRALNRAQPIDRALTSGFPIPDAAINEAQPVSLSPHQEPHLTVADLPPYSATPATLDIIDQIVTVHRERQTNIKAKTKLILQAKALLRGKLCTAEDFELDDTKVDSETATGAPRRKLTKAAAKLVDDAYKDAEAEPMSENGIVLASYFGAIDLFECRQTDLERQMVRLAKQLPVYGWVKSVRGFGDVSFATIVGECGDIGSYKSIAAVWKRLGLAVVSGNRQGSPGAGASAQDWVDHGYNRARRSVSWNARQHVIGGMGKWRPRFGEDVRANPALTEYQCVYAERARFEAEKLGLPVTVSDKGKESYKMHVANRAHRYVEKRLIKHLYLAWRRAA